MSAPWTCLDAEKHVYAIVLGTDVVRVVFDGRPDVCCLEQAHTAARLAQLEASGHRVKEIAIGAPGFGIDRLAFAGMLGSPSDVPIIIEGAARA
jgi:hypothetical protein